MVEIRRILVPGVGGSIAGGFQLTLVPEKADVVPQHTAHQFNNVFVARQRSEKWIVPSHAGDFANAVKGVVCPDIVFLNLGFDLNGNTGIKLPEGGPLPLPVRAQRFFSKTISRALVLSS